MSNDDPYLRKRIDETHDMCQKLMERTEHIPALYDRVRKLELWRSLLLGTWTATCLYVWVLWEAVKVSMNIKH